MGSVLWATPDIGFIQQVERANTPDPLAAGKQGDVRVV